MDKDLVEVFNKELGFGPVLALTFVRAGGRCEYCGRDLLRDRYGYATMRVDHILPKETYPQFKDREENWVLSCDCCNVTKARFDPAYGDEALADLSRRDELIAEARDHIAARMRDYDKLWRRATELLHDAWWARSSKSKTG